MTVSSRLSKYPKELKQSAHTSILKGIWEQESSYSQDQSVNGTVNAASAAPGPVKPLLVLEQHMRLPPGYFLNSFQKVFTIDGASGGFRCYQLDIVHPVPENRCMSF